MRGNKYNAKSTHLLAYPHLTLLLFFLLLFLHSLFCPTLKLIVVVLGGKSSAFASLLNVFPVMWVCAHVENVWLVCMYHNKVRLHACFVLHSLTTLWRHKDCVCCPRSPMPTLHTVPTDDAYCSTVACLRRTSPQHPPTQTWCCGTGCTFCDPRLTLRGNIQAALTGSHKRALWDILKSHLPSWKTSLSPPPLLLLFLSALVSFLYWSLDHASFLHGQKMAEIPELLHFEEPRGYTTKLTETTWFLKSAVIPEFQPWLDHAKARFNTTLTIKLNFFLRISVSSHAVVSLLYTMTRLDVNSIFPIYTDGGYLALTFEDFYLFVPALSSFHPTVRNFQKSVPEHHSWIKSLHRWRFRNFTWHSTGNFMPRKLTRTQTLKKWSKSKREQLRPDTGQEIWLLGSSHSRPCNPVWLMRCILGPAYYTCEYVYIT